MVKPNREINVVTDSSCDLPQRLLERFGIALVPLVVHFGTDSYLDGDLSRDTFWSKVATTTSGPQTSRPSVGQFEQIFGRLMQQRQHVLYVGLTGKHTGTIDTARLAARRFGEAVSVFDSHSLSMGLGFQVLEAARSSDMGRSVGEILERLEDLRSRVHALVVLDTLENVRRGGRADALITVVSRMSRVLSVKPIIQFVDGRVQLLGVSRSFRRATERILETLEELSPLEQVAVMHARNLAAAEALADELAERLAFPRNQILIGETGVVVASHAGAGALGVFAVSRPGGT